MEKMFAVPGWSTSWTVIVDKNKYIEQIRQNLAVISTIFLHTNKFVMESLDELVDKVGQFMVTHMPSIELIAKDMAMRVSVIID